MLRNSCLLSILLIVAVRHRVSCRARLFLTGFVSPCRPTFATLYLVLFGEQKVYLCLFMMLCLCLFAVCQTQVQLLFLVQCLLMSDETWDVFHSADGIVDRKVDIAAIRSKYWPALTRVYCCHFEVLLQETDVPLHIMDAESSVRFALQSVVSFVPLQLHSAPQAIQDLLASPQAALGEGTEKRREVGTYFIILYTVLYIWYELYMYICIYMIYIYMIHI